jgi:DNA-directed RNA polymerase subunit beta
MSGKRPVVTFSKLPDAMPMPNLLDVQVEAFSRLLRTEAESGVQEDVGLERVFNVFFPISDVNEKFSLEFVSYSLGEPK